MLCDCWLKSAADHNGHAKRASGQAHADRGRHGCEGRCGLEGTLVFDRLAMTFARGPSLIFAPAMARAKFDEIDWAAVIRSSPRKRGPSRVAPVWIPACAGMSGKLSP
jgi:hypothetical protein